MVRRIGWGDGITLSQLFSIKNKEKTGGNNP